MGDEWGYIEEGILVVGTIGTWGVITGGTVGCAGCGLGLVKGPDGESPWP